MTTATNDQLSSSTSGNRTPPYPPSWIDTLIHWIAKLQGPEWLFYVLLAAGIIIAGHAFRWFEGSLTRGELDLGLIAEGPIPVYFLALISYLNATAHRSLEAFRPALSISEEEYSDLGYELTTLSRREGLLSVVVGVAVATIGVFGDPAAWGITVKTSFATSIYIFLSVVTVMVFGTAFIFHTIRQLRLVGRIQHMTTNNSILHRGPVYAFSALTVRTGIGIVVIVECYVYLIYALQIFGPVSEVSAFDMIGFAILVSTAGASFVLPLGGMHQRLVREKAQLLSEADRRFETTLDKLHKVADTDKLERIGDLSTLMKSQVLEREMLGKLSTWPWKPQTLRGFLTSVVLPIALWLVTTFLSRIL